MKVILAIALVSLIAGCEREPSSEELTFESLPKGLEDCMFFDLQNKKGNTIRVARCPNSTTTTSYYQSKSTRSVSVIDESDAE